MKVSLTGRIDNRQYDAKDGTKKYISEIVAETVIPFTEKRSGGDYPTRTQDNNDVSQLPDKTMDTVEDIVIPDEMPF
jgi:single-strand DNA-binding protein